MSKTKVKLGRSVKKLQWAAEFSRCSRNRLKLLELVCEEKDVDFEMQLTDLNFEMYFIELNLT